MPGVRRHWVRRVDDVGESKHRARAVEPERTHDTVPPKAGRDKGPGFELPLYQLDAIRDTRHTDRLDAHAMLL